MALNKTILRKLAEKTKANKKQQDFLVQILDEENKGIGQYKKYYKEKIKEATDGE